MAFFTPLSSLLKRVEKTPRALADRAKHYADGLPDLLLRAKTIVEAMRAGPYTQRRAGSGDSFWQHRPYQVGDPTRMIDWKTSARSDHVLVLQKEHQTIQTMMIYCPHTLAMDYAPRKTGIAAHLAELANDLADAKDAAKGDAAATGTSGGAHESDALRPETKTETKFDRALLIAACLMQVFHDNHHPYAALADVQGAAPVLTGSSDAHMMRQLDALCRQSEVTEAEENAVSPASMAVNDTPQSRLLAAPKRSHVFWICDFWESPEVIQQTLLALKDKGCPVHMVQIITQDERILPFTGHVDFRPMNNAAHTDIPQVEGIRTPYQARIAAHLDALAVMAQAADVHYVRYEMQNAPDDDAAMMALLSGLVRAISVPRSGKMI